MERGYGKLSERTLNLVSDFHAIKIVTKEDKAALTDKLKALETHMKEENKQTKNPTDLMKALEALTVQEVQTLQKATTNRVQALEELIKIDRKNIQT